MSETFIRVRRRNIKGRRAARFTITVRPAHLIDVDRITVWIERSRLHIGPPSASPFPAFRAWRPYHGCLDLSIRVGRAFRLHRFGPEPIPALLDPSRRVITVPLPPSRLEPSFPPLESNATIRADAMRLWHQGVPPTVIAGELGVHPNTVMLWTRTATTPRAVDSVSLLGAAQLLGVAPMVARQMIEAAPWAIIAGPVESAMYPWTRWAISVTDLLRAVESMPIIQCRIPPHRCHPSVAAVLPRAYRWVPSQDVPLGAPVVNRATVGRRTFCLIPTTWIRS